MKPRLSCTPGKPSEPHSQPVQILAHHQSDSYRYECVYGRLRATLDLRIMWLLQLNNELPRCSLQCFYFYESSHRFKYSVTWYNSISILDFLNKFLLSWDCISLIEHILSIPMVLGSVRLINNKILRAQMRACTHTHTPL